MSDLRTTWRQMRSWQGAVWLPVLPPLGALVELVFLVALITLADWALPSVGVLSLEPNPYWIPVLLLSLQYGTVAGLLAALAAITAYVLNGFPEQSIGENLFTYVLRIWAMPMLWIGVALLLGQFRLRQIEVKQDLKRRLTQRTDEAATLATYVKELEARCHLLERQATSRDALPRNPALSALTQILQPGADLDVALDAVVGATLPGAALSLFAVTPAGFERVAGTGWGETAAWSKDIASQHPLYRALAIERRAVCVLTKGDENVLLGQGVAAVAVVAPDNVRVVGALKIEDATPEQITPDLPQALDVLARLVAPMLAEPRIVIDNSPRGTRGESGHTRLTAGWRQTAWRGSAPPGGHGAAPTDTATTGARAPWPKLLS